MRQWLFLQGQGTSVVCYYCAKAKGCCKTITYKVDIDELTSNHACAIGSIWTCCCHVSHFLMLMCVATTHMIFCILFITTTFEFYLVTNLGKSVMIKITNVFSRSLVISNMSVFKLINFVSLLSISMTPSRKYQLLSLSLPDCNQYVDKLRSITTNIWVRKYNWE